LVNFNQSGVAFYAPVSGSIFSGSTYYGDGSNLTGIVASSWTSSAAGISRQSDVIITGSLTVSNNLTISGSLFSAYYLNSTANATQSVATFNTSSYTAAFFDYTVASASNARAGSIMSVWNGSTINYTETSTTAIGDTTGVSFTVELSASLATLRSVTTTSDWTIKTTTRAI
jgi:hypothetical protein